MPMAPSGFQTAGPGRRGWAPASRAHLAGAAWLAGLTWRADLDGHFVVPEALIAADGGGVALRMRFYMSEGVAKARR